MRIVNLIENTEGASGCLFEHGLSFYIETKKHKLLMDTGASGNFAVNANKLGIKLSDVDMCVLSHGHYDHSGGIMEFSRINSKAKILINALAGGGYYHIYPNLDKYIGIDPAILELPQLRKVDGQIRIDDELYIFGNISGKKLWPAGNGALMELKDGRLVKDEFRHEQCLVISENGTNVLFSGCAHNGVINVMERFFEIFGTEPDVMVSGFHMQKQEGYTESDIEIIKDTANRLKKYKTKFYTGHCTGEIPFNIMKDIMKEQLEYVHSGDEISVCG